MSALYDDLMAGFAEILDAQKNRKELKTTVIEIPEVKRYSNSEIKAVRNRARLSQALLANYMGVSKKTVAAWERGVNKPAFVNH